MILTSFAVSLHIKPLGQIIGVQYYLNDSQQTSGSKSAGMDMHST